MTRDVTQGHPLTKIGDWGNGDAKRYDWSESRLDAKTQIAIGLWHKFASPNHIEWEDETHKAEYLMAVDDITTGQLFNLLLSRIDFDGMDPRTFSLTELQQSIKGAEREDYERRQRGEPEGPR